MSTLDIAQGYYQIEVDPDDRYKLAFITGKGLQFLGRLVIGKGVSITTESVKCMAEWPTPKSKKDLEAILRYLNYQREHMKSFAEIAAPLYTLTRPKTKFIWNKEKDTAFTSLKEAVTNTGVLKYPSDDVTLILNTDASDMVIGVELSQIQWGKEALISFISKTFTSTQQKYCVTRRITAVQFL
jgi:hypothetical protein